MENIDFNAFGLIAYPAIVVLCYFAAELAKVGLSDYKSIPVICMGTGLILGITGYLTIAAFPADDYLHAAAIGIISGGFSTTVHQVGKLFLQK